MARYTSCPADGSGGPDWLLSADSVKLDLEASQGVAEGAVLRFLGVPILAAPLGELSALGRAQVGLAAADHGPGQRERLRRRRSVLLEHRAEPRRDHHAHHAHAARPGGRWRVPLPRAVPAGRDRPQRAALGSRLRLGPLGRPLVAREQLRARLQPAAALAARFRQRLLEGLSRRDADADAAPAHHRGRAQARVRRPAPGQRLDRDRRGAGLAGAAGQRREQLHGGALSAPAAARRAHRPDLRPGAAGWPRGRVQLLQQPGGRDRRHAPDRHARARRSARWPGPT